MKAVLYTDGASFNNPGPSGLGIVLLVDGEEVVAKAVDAGYGTNNQAEYRAMIEGLKEALAYGVTDLLVRADSQLLIKQMLGEYKVKNKNILPLRMEAEALARKFDNIAFEHVRREFNERADELSKAGAEAAKARGVRGPSSQELFE